MSMKILLSLACAFLSCHEASLIAKDESYWTKELVRSYVHNSELQRRWAWAFYAPYLKELKGSEDILDIGCGDGKITADAAAFIKEGSAIGIDPSEAMLDWAKKQFSSLEYPQLHFQQGGFLDPRLDRPFDLIISNCALQHCNDIAGALKGVSNLLKTNGKALILVPMMDNAAWNKSRKTVQALPEWEPYWRTFIPRKFLNQEEYAALLADAGLTPLKIERVQTEDPFVDREDLLTFLMGTLPPVVPAEKAARFFNAWIDEYLRLAPDALREDGVIEVRFSRLEIAAKKGS